MKSKLFFLSFFLLLTVTNYAQTSANQAGIAIQGIARDNNNTALISKPVSFTFTLYYKDSSNLEQLIFEELKSITTDAFGVFSHIINPTAVNNSKFANNKVYLRIKNDGLLISDEILNHVPYAIAANNGVPTGSIMPFIGTVAPEGWALCNGAALPTTATTLIAMVGANSPNLQGMFLRGTGTSPENNQNGPALKETQKDELKSHLHDKGSLGADNNISLGNLPHSPVAIWETARIITPNTGGFGPYNVVINGLGNTNNTRGNTNGIHNHTISGSTGSTGGNETRPVNYGVNYIIKL